jgi:ketosteroid isomerase-like protein
MKDNLFNPPGRNLFVGLLMTAYLFLGSLSAQPTFGQSQPDQQKLFETIVKLDREFFGAYNTCDVNLDKYGSFYSENIEFYHDRGGLTTSKKDIVEATKRNICGKVTRELVADSIEVYPIKDYGAIEIGFHKFHNKAEKETSPSKPGRFVIVWQNANNEWKITRVISLH